MGKISVKIIDEENGLRLYEEVNAVRIKSEKYSLLIMDDYSPIIGQLDGSISILTGKDEITISDIKAFYRHQHNKFTLLIERGVVQ